MSDSPRIEDLKRRVQMDPASIAFAQLAEEYRRAGAHASAVEVCRAGLTVHPGYLSARVTLARALVELGELDAAEGEFDLVLRQAPENLVALRGRADILRRRGDLAAALAQYNVVLGLAPNDPDLEQTVLALAREVEARASRPIGPAVGQEPEQDSRASGLAAASDDRERALRTLAALNDWLAAIHVARLDRHP